ncbi:DUF2971 domain-containing protein [Lachnospiraceae bacterium CLA-AA-H185]|jgi:hypothetical protein|uniref:DUF2971 domain-containing protein n=1 Tax=Maccoyibacter intestinihominis TaxID=3133499 RepID=A0ABV1HCD6_9FIRM|nr:MAG: hypothetical protein BHV87_05280 [Clostridiales bacterium 36_14]
MENKGYPKVLYHYASMEKGTSILKHKNIRLSDITKSNDVKEMSIFFPDLFDEMLKNYDEHNGFSYKFEYKGKGNRQAFGLFVNELKKKIEKEFEDGSIATFALCLSEEGDLLSQWRGYADDGKGICLGLNVEEILKFVGISSVSGFSLEKVEYLSKEQIDEWVKNVANQMLGIVEIILGAIEEGNIQYYSAKEFDEDIFNTIYYNILSEVEESIKFKTEGFKEEKEWRFFIKNSLNKDDIKGKKITSIGTLGEGARRKTSKYVADNVEFNIKENDMVPFVSLKFEKFHNNLINQVICGPNNKIREKDLELFLRKYGYRNCKGRKTNITYIVR